MMCYHCVIRLGFPRFAISLIGSTKKLFKKDKFEFCPDCFEYLFGVNISFSPERSLATSCHVCNNNVIGTLPYSYFIRVVDPISVGQRRVCGPCSARELFPIITSLLIVMPKG